MCDVGEEATIMNGFLGRINMLDRWGCGGCSVHMAVYGVGFGCTPF